MNALLPPPPWMMEIFCVVQLLLGKGPTLSVFVISIIIQKYNDIRETSLKKLMWDVFLRAMNIYSFHWLVVYGQTEWTQVGKSDWIEKKRKAR